MNGKAPQHAKFHLCDLIKDLEQDENESILMVSQEVMIYSCANVVGSERERQCRILMISLEHKTSVGNLVAQLDPSFLNVIPDQNGN